MGMKMIEPIVPNVCYSKLPSEKLSWHCAQTLKLNENLIARKLKHIGNYISVSMKYIGITLLQEETAPTCPPVP